MSDAGPRCLPAALRWVRYGAGVVPLHDEGPGRLVPAIRWEEDGPLRTEARVVGWYQRHPDDRLAITLDNPARKLLLVDDDSGKHPVPEDKPRPRPLPGYLESTRSGGVHILAEYKVRLPPNVPRRVIGLGGYVDLLLEGIAYVAPTINAGRGEYKVVDGREPAVFESVSLALQAAEPIGHPWLLEAWKNARLPTSGTGGFVRDRRPVPKDVDELLARMARTPAGAVAAWIGRNTDGANRAPFLCFHVGHHAWASGGSPDQVRAVVRCPHEEWGDGFETLARRFARRAPAGLPTLLRFPEGRGAQEDLIRSNPELFIGPTYRPASHDLVSVARRARAARRSGW
jgi:hypothetical protein